MGRAIYFVTFNRFFYIRHPRSRCKRTSTRTERLQLRVPVCRDACVTHRIWQQH